MFVIVFLLERIVLSPLYLFKLAWLSLPDKTILPEC